MKTAQIICLFLAVCCGVCISAQQGNRRQLQADLSVDASDAEATQADDSTDADSSAVSEAEPATKVADDLEAKPVSKGSGDDDAQSDEQRLLSEEHSDQSEFVETSSAARSSSASSSESADGLDETEKSLETFHRRYAKEKQEAKQLREELTKATAYGKNVQKQLRVNLKAYNEKTRQTQLFMARKAKEDAVAMEMEKKRENVLESLFAKTNHSLAERDQELAETHSELNATKKQRARLSASALRALRAERKQEAKLEADVEKNRAALKASKNKLDHENAELKVARTEWKAEEMRLLKAERTESSRNAVLEGNLSKLVAEARSLNGAKQRADQLLVSLKSKSTASLQDAQRKLTAAKSRELTLRKALDGDHKKMENEETTLTKELAVWKKRANNAQASALQLGREVKLRASGDREEMKELKKNLENKMHETQELNKQRSELDAQLQGNATRRSRLEEEVQRLRQQLKDGEAARKKAEAIAKKAQADTAKAQAVAKQLSGTVPRLLEQAQLAHERRDAMTAMKKAQSIVLDSSATAAASKASSNDTADELSQLPADELASEVEQAADADDKTSQNIPGPEEKELDSDADAESDGKSQPANSLDSDSDGLSQMLGAD